MKALRVQRMPYYFILEIVRAEMGWVGMADGFLGLLSLRLLILATSEDIVVVLNSFIYYWSAPLHGAVLPRLRLAPCR